MPAGLLVRRAVPAEPSTQGGASDQRFHRLRAAKFIGLSLTINALCPFLAYRALQAHFPAGSIKPLLCATIFPVVGLLLSFVRKRSIDAIAILAIVGITEHLAVTIIAGNVITALVARSLDGALIGSVLLISHCDEWAARGRPNDRLSAVPT